MHYFNFRSFLAILLIAGILPGCRTAIKPIEPNWSTFVIVRHAEKISSAPSAGLTPEGKARARRLADMLADAPVKAVWSTDFMRTIETARPSAELHNVSIQLYAPQQLDSLVTVWKSLHREGIVLITGHSNTTPALANRFIESEKFPEIAETDYSQLFIVTCREDLRCTAVRLKY